VPKYDGWLALGDAGRGYGFVFSATDANGKSAAVLVAWMPVGQSGKLDSSTMGRDVRVVDAATGAERSLDADQTLLLTEAPVILRGLSAQAVKGARTNAGKPFPWGGNFAGAMAVECRPGQRDVAAGIIRGGYGDYPSVRFTDGSTGVVVPGDIGHALSFVVHPSFGKVDTREYYVRATMRRLGPGNVGMNLLYETADSKGRSPYSNAGKWFGAKNDGGWQTYTWRIGDAAFSKMWGNDFSIRPEQSVPFAIGKVEVSVEPFEGGRK
jgi:hypothetical protein